MTQTITSKDSKVTIRPAVADDIAQILTMIKELATFERAAEKVKATHDSLQATITFAPTVSDPHPEQKLAKAILITVRNDDDEEEEQVAGMAVYFYNYSTWTSRPGVYLEDLFVRPEWRRKGFATLLLQELGREAEKIAGGRELARLEWSCLKWNEGALKFYERIGGKVGHDWVKVRCEEDGLGVLANAKAAG